MLDIILKLLCMNDIGASCSPAVASRI